VRAVTLEAGAVVQASAEVCAALEYAGAAYLVYPGVQAGQVPLQMLALGLLVALIALDADGVRACAAGTARRWFAGSPRRIETLGATGGVAMVGVGVALATTGHRD
jgi:threonine/homoserine/homoserine lactone efflux protein